MPILIEFPGVYLEAIDQDLRSALSPSIFPLPSRQRVEFNNILLYHMGWVNAKGQPVVSGSGKRLRPLICLLSCEAASITSPRGAQRDWHAALPAASAIELVHNFSLIHDDIEDNSAQRHGRATVWKVWGAAQGVNAGDAMFALARLSLDRLRYSVAPSTYLDVQFLFDTATLGLTQGQYLDLSFEQRPDVSVEDYLLMVRGKTGALMAAAAEIGARVAAEDRNIVSAFGEFGTNLGIAFQIADDILGVWGDPAVTGKPVGDDIISKKKSYPLLAALPHDSNHEIADLFKLDHVSTEDVRRVTAALNRMNSREDAEIAANEYVRRAVRALEGTGLENKALGHLTTLARTSSRRPK